MLIESAEEHNKRDLMIFIKSILDITRQDRHIGESCLFIAYNNIRTQCMEHHISKTGKEGINLLKYEQSLYVPARDHDVMIHVTTFYKTWSINAWLL